MSKKKRRQNLDINKRQKAKDYTEKKQRSGERFQENIVEKESKLNFNTKDEEKPRKKRIGKSVREEVPVPKEDSISESNKPVEKESKLNFNIKDEEKSRKKRIGKSVREEVPVPKEDSISESNKPVETENPDRKEFHEESDIPKQAVKEEKKTEVQSRLNKRMVYAHRKMQEKKLDTKKVRGTQDFPRKVSDKTFSAGGEKALRKESKRIHKRQRAGKLYSKSKTEPSGKLLHGVSESSLIASDVFKTDGEEGPGGEALSEGLGAVSHGSRFAENRLQNRKRGPRFRASFGKGSGEFSKAESVQKNRAFQKKTEYKKYLKKKQMKKRIYEEKNVAVTVKGRIKQEATKMAKGSLEILSRNKKKIGLFGALLLGMYILFSMLTSTAVGGISAINSEIVSTSYLSSTDMLNNIDQEFSSYEYALENEISNIKENHLGYDEYEIDKDCDIGHDMHQLFSYVTARFGEVKNVSDISDNLAELFNSMYTVTYDEEVETRYREVCREENGEKVCEEEPYEWKKLIVTVRKKDMDTVVRDIFADYTDNLKHYETLLETKGNMEAYFGSGSGDMSEVVNNPDFKNPGIAFTEKETQQLFHEAEKHIGKRYVFGASGPANFDCSSFVCWSFTHSGIKNMPRTTAYLIYKNYCNPVSPGEAKAGDIIFFKGTYATSDPITHVGIYAGNGMMIHAGNPIQFTSINSNYWKQHFYGFGRPK